MKKEWNKNHFQGKSKNSVETSYRVIAVCLIIGTIILTWGLVYKLIEIIF